MAGVAELEASTDLGYAYLLRKVAAQHKIKYILEGHSFIEEGLTPLGKNYFDGLYIKKIHEKYGTKKIETYPVRTFGKCRGSVLLDRPKFIRPFWYMNYNKEDAKRYLSDHFGWEYYGGHHLENRMTSFLHSIYLPEKFNLDLRNNVLSAQVRNHKKERLEAIREYRDGAGSWPLLARYFKKRLQISDEDYSAIMRAPPRNWRQFPTYKRRFERLRFLFFIFAKFELVPMSFYLKYCRKN